MFELALTPPSPALLNLFFDALQRLFEVTIEWLIQGLVNLLEWLLAGEIVEQLLAVQPNDEFANFAAENQFQGLNDIYDDMVVVYFAFLTILITLQAITRIMFPMSEQTSLLRFGSRVIIATVVVLMGEMIWFWVWEIYNHIGHVVWVSGGGPGMSMDLEFMSGGIVGGSGMSIIILVAIFGFLYYMGTGLIFSLLVFWTALAIRLVFVNTTFALTPLLVAMWIPEGGLAKYLKQAAGTLLSVTAIMLFLGIVIAGLLSVGGVLAGSQDGLMTDAENELPGPPVDQPQGEASSPDTEPPTDSRHEFEFGDEPVSDRDPPDGEFAGPADGAADAVNDGGAAIGDALGTALTFVIFKISVWLGTMWACIAGIVAIFGRFATGGGGGGGGGGRQERAKKAGSLAGKVGKKVGGAVGGWGRRNAGRAIGGAGGILSGAGDKIGSIGGGSPTGAGAGTSISNPDAGDLATTMQSAGESAQELGETVKTTPVTERVGDAVDDLKDWHQDMKGVPDTPPDPEDTITDADVASMDDDEVDAQTVDELEYDGLSDDDVQTLTEGDVDSVDEFEWDDAVRESENGYAYDTVGELDDDKFEAESLDQLKSEVKHDDYDTAMDIKDQREQLQNRIDEGEADIDGDIEDLSQDELEEERRERMLATLGDAGITGDDLANRDAVRDLDTDELAGLEREARVGPHSVDSRVKQGYAAGATVGGVARDAAKASAGTWLTKSGTDAWRDLARKARESDHLSEQQYYIGSSPSGAQDAVDPSEVNPDELETLDPESAVDQETLAAHNNEQVNVAEDSDETLAFRPSQPKEGQGRNREQTFDVEDDDKDEWGIDEIDAAEHGHGSGEPGHTMLVRPDESNDLDEPHVMEILETEGSSGTGYGVRFYDPKAENQSPAFTEQRKVNSIRNGGVREYPNDVGIWQDEDNPSNRTPYRSLHGSRYNDTIGPEEAADYRQIKMTEHTEIDFK